MESNTAPRRETRDLGATNPGIPVLSGAHSNMETVAVTSPAVGSRAVELEGQFREAPVPTEVVVEVPRHR